MPHLNPMSHLRNMFGYFLVATVVTFMFGFGTTVTGSWLLAAPAAVLVAAISLAGGLLITMQGRALLGWMQTGRFIQWGAFIASAYVGLLAAGYLFSSAISVANPLMSALVLFAFAFGPATLFGQVPWKGRTWLPVSMPRR